MTKGELYNSLKSRLDFYLDRLDIVMTDSVLHDAASCDEMCTVFEEICRIVPEKEYLFVEHGNPYFHCAANTYLQQSFDKKGYKNVKVIQLKERDSFGQAIAFLKERKADETNAQVVIIPLIVARGDYMANELYNAQDSFMWKLRNAGYDEVLHKYDIMLDWLAGLYVNSLNLIQYMHDKYYYEAAEMALIDTDVRRTFATGIAGFSHVVDSLSAIKYAKVKPIRDEEGITVSFETEGDFPRYGNDDDRADDIAVWLLKTFLTKIKKYHTYRNSEPTTSILTITSNVVYGKATGATPDGREAYKPFAPGGNPSYGAEKEGLLASLNSVAKVPYEYALDGISNTQTISPEALGHSLQEQKNTLVNVMDGYFDRGAHHLNVNVFGT